MTEDEEKPRRPRGRPQVRPDGETIALIVDAARAEFLSRGFGNASVTAIARRAGVSTKTLYRLVPTKSDLFRDVIKARIGRVMLAIDRNEPDGQDVGEGLRRLLATYGELVLGFEATSIYRLALIEHEQFPEITGHFYADAIDRVAAAMEAWLTHQCNKGRIRLDDCKAAGGMLRGMMAMEPQRAFLLGKAELPSQDEIEDRAAACADLFLNGCKVVPPPAREAGRR